MITIGYLFEETFKGHMKKHWGKYAMLGGGLAASAVGKELEDMGTREAKSFLGSEEDASRLKKIGSAMRKGGHMSTGGGVVLGLKGQLDDEKRAAQKNK
jgi:hypothetical protein